MRRFAVTHDYLCPFARNAAEVVVRALEGGEPAETRPDVVGIGKADAQAYIAELESPPVAEVTLPVGGQ